jgi:hypothetical protein
MEDLIHEIYTVGPKFRQANRFLWPYVPLPPSPRLILTACVELHAPPPTSTAGIAVFLRCACHWRPGTALSTCNRHMDRERWSLSPCFKAAHRDSRQEQSVCVLGLATRGGGVYGCAVPGDIGAQAKNAPPRYDYVHLV